MYEVILFLLKNWQILLTGAFCLILAVVFVSQLVLLRNVRRIRENMDSIREEVGDYLSVVMMGEAEEFSDEMRAENRAAQEKTLIDEENSRIISSVLQEIFP